MARNHKNVQPIPPSRVDADAVMEGCVNKGLRGRIWMGYWWHWQSPRRGVDGCWMRGEPAGRFPDVSYERLPDYMQGSAREYVEDGYVSGGFLRAVLENDLTKSFGYADSENKKRIEDWALWLFNDAPSACWGSKDKVDAWIKECEKRREETR